MLAVLREIRPLLQPAQGRWVVFMEGGVLRNVVKLHRGGEKNGAFDKPQQGSGGVR